MNLRQQFSKYLTLLILLGVEAGAQAEVADKTEWSINSLPGQNEAWCSIVPYLQQNEAGGHPPSRRDEGGWLIGFTHGIIWGRAREIVFDDSGVPNQNDYLSELTWELRRVFVLGIDSIWQGKKSNALEMKFKFAIPKVPVGKMSDYDWFYTDRDWSHWSQSDVKLRWGFLFDFLYEEVLVSSDYFKLKLGAGYHMDWWGWRDELADSLYSTFVQRVDRDIPDKFNRDLGDKFRDKSDVLPVGENGIDYWAMYHVPLISIRFSFEWDTISLSALSRIGPSLGITKDHHLRRREFGPDGVFFYDVAIGGPWLDISLELKFEITDRFSFFLRGEYAWLNETRGLTIIVPTNTESPSVGGKVGGFAFQRIGVNALVFWKLGE